MKKKSSPHKSLSHQDTLRSAIRDQMRKHRSALGDDAQTAAAVALKNNICNYLSNSQPNDRSDSDLRPLKIAGYRAIGGEISMQASFEWMQAREIQTYLPVVKGEILKFARFTQATDFIEGKFGISTPEYSDADLLSATQLDVVFVPLTAFDEQGNRLGMGGGFYDKSFAYRQQPGGTRHQRFVGVAYEFQRHDELPAEAWDVTLQAVITDRETYVMETYVMENQQ